MTSPSSRILIGLDFDNADDAIDLAGKLAGRIGGFKVGLELVNAAGFDIFDRLKDAGAERIFYDAKFHDIPNTVAGAVRAAAKRGLWMINVHTTGGAAMMRAARDAASSAQSPPLLIGVTILTSIDSIALSHDLRVSGTVADQVSHLANLAQTCGLDGVVASTHELKAIRKTCGDNFLTVIPGIRPAGASVDDQARVATPGTAVADGADYIVIGRAITRAADPVAAAIGIAEEIRAAESALAGTLKVVSAAPVAVDVR